MTKFTFRRIHNKKHSKRTINLALLINLSTEQELRLDNHIWYTQALIKLRKVFAEVIHPVLASVAKC